MLSIMFHFDFVGLVYIIAPSYVFKISNFRCFKKWMCLGTSLIEEFLPIWHPSEHTLYLKNYSSDWLQIFTRWAKQASWLPIKLSELYYVIWPIQGVPNKEKVYSKSFFMSLTSKWRSLINSDRADFCLRY